MTTTADHSLNMECSSSSGIATACLGLKRTFYVMHAVISPLSAIFRSSRKNIALEAGILFASFTKLATEFMVKLRF
jgi:hypothetical protein